AVALADALVAAADGSRAGAACAVPVRTTAGSGWRRHRVRAARWPVAAVAGLGLPVRRGRTAAATGRSGGAAAAGAADDAGGGPVGQHERGGHAAGWPRGGPADRGQGGTGRFPRTPP